MSSREALQQSPVQRDEGRAASRSGAGRDSTDRRASGDRRSRPTKMLDSLFGVGRRRLGRREGETENSYVDVYHRRDVMLMAAIFILNVFDALFTLIWLQKGGIEGNPIMDLMIRAGDGVFLAQKCFVVGLWLLVLTVHKNFRIARMGMWMLLLLYGSVLVYHFYLQLGDVSPVIVIEG